jgi:hypothetical protein
LSLACFILCSALHRTFGGLDFRSSRRRELRLPRLFFENPRVLVPRRQPLLVLLQPQCGNLRFLVPPNLYISVLEFLLFFPLLGNSCFGLSFRFALL